MTPLAQLKKHTAGAGTSGNEVVEVIHLYKSFGNHVVLNDMNLVLHEGENLVVLGKSGSGKSVLIKCISGLVKPDSGIVRIFGKDILDLPHKELDRLRVNIGYLFQYSALYDSMTVAENLAFPLRRHMRNKRKEEVMSLIKETLENVGLAHAIDMMPADLSGGMRKRIGLARALILKPKLILYDEPTAGLDPMTSKEISELIVEVQETYEASSIVITHDITCAEIVANRVMVLAEGRAYAEGTLNELRKMEDPKVKGFF